MEKITKSSDKVLIDPNEPLILPDGTALVGRVEWFLYALCCLDYQNLPTPMSRIEEFANALITGEIPNIQPQSRAEQFFLAILDGNISDLPQPQSRSEVLLDKLARGEFDLSDVEPIQSRYELLLAYLIKNGGIGNIDYVLYEFSEAMKTMYNTVEKPFKSLELSGNTLVNCVLEDTENDDYTSFDEDYSGTSFTINGTSEGAIKSAILTGNTLVNISEINRFSFSGGGKKISTSLKMIKSNTDYTRIVYITKNTLTGVNERNAVAQLIGLSADKPLFAEDNQIALNETGLVYNKCINSGDLSSKLSTSHIRIFSVNTGGVLEGYEIIVEGDYTHQDIPFFTGMQSVKMPVLTTTGKNLAEQLLPLNSNGGSETTTTVVDSSSTIATLIEVGGNITLTVSKENVGSRFRYFMYRENPVKGVTMSIGGEYVDNRNTVTFTTQPDTKYLLVVWCGDKNIDYPINPQIEYGNQVTPYEPYKSNILTANEEVELRGIGEVKDELNLLTGELTQRIGEAIYTEKESWYHYSNNEFDNSSLFSCTSLKIGDVSDSSMKTNFISDRFTPSSLIYVQNIIGSYIQNGSLFIRVKKEWLTTPDVYGLQRYLQQNPITVQYPLATESVKTVDLNVVDQNNTKIDKIHVFDEVTHVNASSDELTPTVNIGKSVSYPTIIKPNTKYTVDLKRNDKPLTVNLGGTEVTFTSGETRKTITTPSTLTNDKLSYYGVGAKCNEIMLIEGEVEGNVDYFTGMQSVVMQNQMPILSTVGKNLFSCSLMMGLWDKTQKKPILNDNYFCTTDLIRVHPNTIVKVSGTAFNHEASGNVIFYDKDKKYLGDNMQVWVLNKAKIPSNAHYMAFHFGVSYLYDINGTVQIEIVDDVSSPTTAYEPYKTSILSLPEEVILRNLPSGVCDTFNTITSIYTKRIGEVVLDGSYIVYSNQSSGGYSSATSTAVLLNLKSSELPQKRETKFVCKDLPYYPHSNSIWMKHTLIDTGISGVSGAWDFCIRLPHTVTGGASADSDDVIKQKFKEYLNANPITVQYELATPIVKTVDLSIVDQDGNTIPKIKSYNGVTHLEVTVPKQSLLPHISAEVATDNSKDMSSLTIKHQEISETQSAIQDNIQSQSDEIDTALMATTEIFESILE